MGQGNIPANLVKLANATVCNASTGQRDLIRMTRMSSYMDA